MSTVSIPNHAPPFPTMTTSTPLFLSTFPDTSTTSTSSNPTSSSNPGVTSSAALYLYTFLATLVLLLAVSSAIVIRSLILRRRHQQIVEEAIRAGRWDPQAYGPRTTRRRRDIGKKPKLWEAWLRGSDHGATGEKCAWNDIMPIYATQVASSTQSPKQEPIQIQSEQSRTMRFLRPFHTQSSSLASPSVAPAPISLSPQRSASPTVRVAVLVAMPVPPQQHLREVDGPPVVELGVVQLPMRDAGPTE